MKMQLDGIIEPMQPDGISWEQPKRLGTTGLGAPVFAPYHACRLAFSRMTIVQYQRWFAAWSDGDTHDVTLPHPESGTLTAYTVYVASFDQRLNVRDPCEAAANGVDITLTRVAVS